MKVLSIVLGLATSVAAHEERMLATDAFTMCLSSSNLTLCLDDSLSFSEDAASFDLASLSRSSKVTLASGQLRLDVDSSCVLIDGSDVSLGSCGADLFAFVEHGTDRYSFRDSSKEVCLSAVSEDGSSFSVSSTSILNAELCFDSDSCEDDNATTCAEREVFQVFDTAGLSSALAEELEQFVPSGPPNTIPPSPKPYQPFSDRFKRIYQSAFLVIIFGVVCVVIWRYDLVPQSVKDITLCGCFNRDERNVLEGVDIRKKKDESTASSELKVPAEKEL